MKNLLRSRRQFVSSGLAALTFPAPAALRVFQSGQGPVNVSVSVRRKQKDSVRVPANFMGLSYETSQLAHAGFFSPQDDDLVQMFRTLTTAGVLRIGGNTSEFSHWDASPLDGPADQVSEGPDTNGGAARRFAIHPQSIDHLAEFLTATQWTLIYGLNLAGGDLENAIAEARYVRARCGDRLLAFQLGNEPEMFHHGDDKKARWSFDEYLERWRGFAGGLRKALGDVPLAGPDIAYKTDWVGRFAKEAGGEVRFVSGHFYPEGPPTDPSATTDYLLHNWTKFAAQVSAANAAARESGVAYRMTEGNSCYNGGKAGVSNTFASALWAAEMCLRAADEGCAGVNLHGGGNGLYTPIRSSAASGLTAMPEFYGLLLADACAGAEVLEVQASGCPQDLHVHAYAIADRVRLVFVNMGGPATVTIAGLHPRGSGVATMTRLQAPGLDAEAGVTFGGQVVEADGSFPRVGGENVRLRDGFAKISVDAQSGALLEIA